ncbi:MAG: response regulator [Candidatus Magnetomorum sp.]|nr:response regulator [Candidatus Magnetomorum sp.]
MDDALFSNTPSDKNDIVFFSEKEDTGSHQDSSQLFDLIQNEFDKTNLPGDKNPDSYWKVLIVDDENDIHTVTKMALKQFVFKEKKLLLLHAFSAHEAKEILKEQTDIALVLLDIVMEKNNAGLELVHYIRNELSNPFTRIILRTGQPGHAPEKEIVDLYEIDDYKLKTQLTIEKLASVVTTSLRNYNVFMELENHRQAFDQQVKERTKELEQKNSELLQAKEIAKAIDKGKDHFLEDMSHEIRTPLYSVIGMTELLSKSGQLDASQKEIVEIILSSGDNIITIINDIIDLSKIETGEITLQQEPVHLSNCLEKVIKLMKPAAESKKIRLQCDIEETVPTFILCDDVRLSQIMINLVNNAIKFSNKGVIQLSVKTHRPLFLSSSDDPSLYLEFSVKDEGIGIPESRREEIFQPFSQTDVSIFRKYGGTGLGLAICKMLCERMSGKIWVDSILDKGSTFFFTIKTAVAQTLENSLENHACDSRDKDHLNTFCPLRILVVDDIFLNRKVSEAYLKALGHYADLAQNGFEAIHAFKKKSYDIVFMDIVLPFMNGLETTKQIRKMFSGEKSPVIIALTANVQDKTKKDCFDAGMNDFLVKPLTLDVLKKTLSRWEPTIYERNTIKRAP